MSTLYLFDGHTAPIADSRIVDVRSSEVGTSTPIPGRFAVRVEDDVQIPNPTDLNTLLTDKYAALLAQFPGFTDIRYDDMLDPAGINTVASSGDLTAGERGGNSVRGGWLYTAVGVPLSSTPTQAVVLWEAFKITESNPRDGMCVRNYVEANSSEFVVGASFDNGVNYTTLTGSGILTPIVPAFQGDQLALRFSNASGPAVFVGSWAVIY